MGASGAGAGKCSDANLTIDNHVPMSAQDGLEARYLAEHYSRNILNMSLRNNTKSRAVCVSIWRAPCRNTLEFTSEALTEYPGLGIEVFSLPGQVLVEVPSLTQQSGCLSPSSRHFCSGQI